MISTIIFDFGKVLVDYDFDQFFRKLHADYPLPDSAYQEFIQIIFDEKTYSDFDREVTPIDQQVQRLMAEHPDCAILFDAFSQRFQEVITGEVKGMNQLLATLRGNGYKLYGLSNWSSKVYDTMHRLPHLFSQLQGRVLSCEEHLLKPEPEIYATLLQRFNLIAEECVFIDDKQANVDGSINAGIDAILFTDAETLCQEFRRRGVNC